MSNSSPFYVTTPIYYVNDRPHLGHVYTTMVADVVARFHRLKGEDTFFLTGVDEHATKVADMAANHGLSPQAWADQNAGAFQDVFRELAITNDDFVRTSAARHKKRVTRYVEALLDSGDVYPGEYEGWYDAGQEEYVSESRAEQNDYRSAINGKPLVRKTEKNYFFKLASYREPLLSFYGSRDQAGEPFVRPDARKNEVVNRIKEMEDVPISRTGSRGWGVAIPGDAEQTIYVWIDALFNYLTHVDTSATDDELEGRRKYWQSGAVHLIAKDILWFHAGIWPALLLALRKCPGFEWVNLPRQVYAHSYWVSEAGEKMSKSLGNFLDPQAIRNYINEFGLDALRFFLATRGPLGVSDSIFNARHFIHVYNSDLANTFGNCCSRVVTMIHKYFGGVLPDPLPEHKEGYHQFPISDWSDAYERHFDSMELSRVGETCLLAVREVDAYIERKQPFRLARDHSMLPAAGSVLFQCAEALRIASVLLWPLLPNACQGFWRQIGCSRYAQQLAHHGAGDLASWVQWGHLAPGTPIEQGPALFPRFQVSESTEH